MTALSTTPVRLIAAFSAPVARRDFVAELTALADQIRKEENGTLFVRAGSMKLDLTRAYVMPGSTKIMRLHTKGAVSVGDQLDFLIGHVSRIRGNKAAVILLRKLATCEFPTDAQAEEIENKAEADKKAVREAQAKAQAGKKGKR